jgi:pimeloyl-ACP methyl ester carboxylesterase
MLHGAGSARWAFDLLVPHLDGRFVVHAVDRRGRGEAADDGPYSIEAEVEDALGLLDRIGPGTTLFGHSYGALVAAAAAPRAEGLERVALYEPPMGGVLASGEWRERFAARIAAGDRDRAVTDFLTDIGGYSQSEIDAMRGTPAWAARLELVPTVIRELDAESAYELPAEALATLDIPVLLLVGSRSPEWARRSTDAYAAAIPGARVVVLEGQGHGATAGAPELVAAELLRFSEPGPARSGG